MNGWITVNAAIQYQITIGFLAMEDNKGILLWAATDGFNLHDRSSEFTYFVVLGVVFVDVLFGNNDTSLLVLSYFVDLVYVIGKHDLSIPY